MDFFDEKLGSKTRTEEIKAILMIKKRKWLRRREIWMVLLGVVLHTIYVFSIFDIYFQTPIVHGVEPVIPRFHAPAKRLILIVSDGMRADKFFEMGSDGNYRAPFLRSIIRGQGRWGVSHGRAPTESRPSHVAMIGGFYEDPSAVTKAWKANPVEFDSVFKRSSHVINFGTPDTVSTFCRTLPHSTCNSFPPSLRDTATDASILDEWSFDQFWSLLHRSKGNPTLKELLLKDKLVGFLHLQGCDSNGHWHLPNSSTYSNNVKVADSVAERVYNLVEDYFRDNRTAYIFTADHGMSDDGNHGDGHSTVTDTPLVVWGAGIKYPKPASSSNHDMSTPVEWGLHDIERVDVNQVDIAPLMSTVLGLPCPVNSIGSLPLGYINMSKAAEVEAMLANTKQILNQFTRKSKLKQAESYHFKPFKPLANHSAVLAQIEVLISARNYSAAIKLSENLRSLALRGLHYFQTYDWLMLKTATTLGYIGYMIYLVLHVLQSYTPLPEILFGKDQAIQQAKQNIIVQLSGFLLIGTVSYRLYLEHSPPLYYAYTSVAAFLWTQVLNQYQFLKVFWRHLQGKRFYYVDKILATCTVSVFILEFLVNSFLERRLYTWCFLLVGFVASGYLFKSAPWRSRIPIFVCVACWFLSVFTSMPAKIPNNNRLITASGFMIITFGIGARCIVQCAKGNMFWLSICNREMASPKFSVLFVLQALLVGLSSVMVWLLASIGTQKQELSSLHQFINWSISGISLILPLFLGNGVLSRLTSIFLGFAPTFLMLSIGYEAVFYGAVALVLMAWVLFENTLFNMRKEKWLSMSLINVEDDLSIDKRYLQLSDVRIPLVFAVLLSVGFFGTGNLASIATLEISSAYRFITNSSRSLMASLLIFKLLIPLMLIMCVFSAIIKLHRLPWLGCYFLVIIFSDIMIIHLFFLVRNTGSWLEMGSSITHFVIVSGQVVLLLLLFGLTHIYTKNIQIGSMQHSYSSRKVK